MRILFIGDYSNLHATLASELRRRGHHVDVMSDGCGYMNVPTDFFIERRKGFFGGFRYLYDLFNLLPRLKDYDVVQLINSNFLSLRPGKIKYFFERIKDQNRSVFLTLAGNDYYFSKACNDAKIFRFSEFKIGDKPTEFHTVNPERLYGWISNDNKKWSEYLYEKIDGAVSVLPEYDMAAKDILGNRLTFSNLPIDLSNLNPNPIDFDKPIKLFIGMRGGMEVQKGTRILHTIAKDIERELPEKVEVECVRNLSLKEYLLRMNSSNIVLDQLYSYSPGMNALYAMALGKVAGTGAQPEYYEYLGNPPEKPVFCLSPLDTDIKERLVNLVNNPDEIARIGQESRKLVETHNDVKIVAERFLNHWKLNS